MKVIREGKVKEVKRLRKGNPDSLNNRKRDGDFYIGKCWCCGQQCLCEDLTNGSTRHLPLTDEIRELFKG